MTAFRIPKQTLVVAVLIGSMIDAGYALTEKEIKEAVKCRKTIASQSAALIKTELGAIDKCHKTRDKGKTSVDCNAIGAADVNAKVPATEGKAAGKIDKTCGPADVNDPVLRNYLPDGDVDSNVFPALRSLVEDSSEDFVGTPGLGGTKAEKAKIKCHGALAGERSKIINEVVKAAVKCQSDQDKLADEASDFSSLAGACATPAPKPNHAEKIQKACAEVVGSDGTELGSCNGLPECLVNGARASGETLAAAIFGQPAECGNHITEPGEGCDDGNLTSGDGCDANCTPSACGNGIKAGAEACDDGNTLDTDQCVGQCQLATCGDGFVETGREECGDAPPDACANPGSQTCFVTQCGPPIGTRDARVTLAVANGKSVGSMVVRIDYREDKVRIPGTQDDDNVKSRVVTDPSIQGLNTRSDLDFRLDVSFVPSAPLQSGSILQIKFDECAVSTIDEYSCRVTEAFDESGLEDITSDVTCTIAFL